MDRPKDWNELALKALYGKGEIRSNEEEEAFELGADAMLEGLRLNGYVSGESLTNMGGVGWKNISPKSKWYFIPDET